jgi:hypothetical protein
MESNATFKGLIILGAKKWFAENKSPEEFETFVKAFPENEREYWTKAKVMPISKIPASMYVNLYKIICTMWSDELFQKIGGAVALNDLGTILRIFIKIGTPSFTAKSFPNSYKQYFNVGEFKTISMTSNSAEFELIGAEPYGQAGCSGILGWSRMALEYAGAKQLTIDHSECLNRGKKHCVFKYAWE